MSVLFSADLLIVYAIDDYLFRCQKMESLRQLRLLRAHQRWGGSQIIPQSIERFLLERRNRSRRSLFGRTSTSVSIVTREAANGELAVSAWSRFAIGSEDARLPPYYRLCFMVQDELSIILRIVYTLRPISTPLSYFLAFSGIGHIMLCVVGRTNWFIAMWKYSLFSLACMGIWFDETYEAYRIEALVREFTNSDPEEATLEFVKLTIASRVILLQALGYYTTLISIVVITTCEAPLFVFSPKLRKNIPPLLHLNARGVALDREIAEVQGKRSVDSEHEIRVEEWVIIMRLLSIFLTESRLVVFLLNLVSLSLTLFILNGVELSTEILALLLLAALPYYVGSTLKPILYIGKRLNLTDEDFRKVFLGWLSKPYEFCRSVAVGIQESEVSRLFVHLFRYLQTQVVHPLILDEAGLANADLSEALEGVDVDSSYGIPMPSENFDALISNSIESESDMEDEAIDIVIDSGDSSIDGSEKSDNYIYQVVGAQQLNVNYPLIQEEGPSNSQLLVSEEEVDYSEDISMHSEDIDALIGDSIGSEIGIGIGSDMEDEAIAIGIENGNSSIDLSETSNSYSALQLNVYCPLTEEGPTSKVMLIITEEEVDDISMPSEDIDALIGDSMGSESDSDMQGKAVDIIVIDNVNSSIDGCDNYSELQLIVNYPLIQEDGPDKSLFATEEEVDCSEDISMPSENIDSIGREIEIGSDMEDEAIEVGIENGNTSIYERYDATVSTEGAPQIVEPLMIMPGSPVACM